MSGEWNGPATLSGTIVRAPAAVSASVAASTPACGAGDDDLARRVVVGEPDAVDVVTMRGDDRRASMPRTAAIAARRRLRRPSAMSR